MMRKLIALTLMLSLFLCGCSADSAFKAAWDEGVSVAESQAVEASIYRDSFINPYFEKVGEDSERSFTFYRDVLTDVMYVTYTASSTNGRGTAISVMHSADGTPLLYSEWLQLNEEVPGDD